ncbi:MauE/DoxX family redox-associated membrane protein [Rhodococcus sp. SGAir0479]|uniref:MauE/DoxX family redox-associated membrane protein n=1 Tax=Rhodococcus sp. SGAir0479 TaxID=2567884 RepID=UPI0010CD31B0|nr:MauE/DoxX family redox-associated membrane protein [Rhodococcus sp. SGAir0479]QCQ92897.1 methylamine utilization protein [Rhodococcus sp. SGAir0479]
MLWMLSAAIVGGVLLLAGAPKIRDREGLLRAVRGYRLLPPPAERMVAAALPAVEIALGVALIAGLIPRAAAASAAVLFTGFFLGLAVNLLRGRRELDCGCFAFGRPDDIPRIGWFHAVRAGALAVVSGALAGTAPAALTVGEHLLAVIAALVVLAAVAAGVQLRSIVHPGRRPVDTHLSRASIELRVASAISRY